MKTLYKSLALTVAVIGLSSCVNEWLDLDPSTGAPSSSAIVTYNDAKTAMYGMYDGLQGNSTYTEYYAARMFYYGDVRGDDMQARTQGMRSSSCYEMRYGEDDAPSIWNVPYNVIRRANRIIEAVDNGAIADKDDYEAEVNSIYAQAKVDLTDAIDMNALPVSTKPGENQGYIDQWAAKALLSRVYLYMNNDKGAFDMAEDVIKNSPYQLWAMNQYAAAWDKSDANHTSEMIFELINSGSDDWADREGIGYLYNEDGYADAICTKSFVDMLSQDANDVRINVILPVQMKQNEDGTPSDMYKTYGDNRIFIDKFPMGSEGDMRLQNLPILRLSEMYLNAAEAAMKLGNTSDAAYYLNELIQNRTTTSSQQVTASNVSLERILLERRKELVGEGQRFFDAMRNNETIVRYEDENNKGWHYSLNADSRKFDRTYFRALLPIPVSEVNANSVLREQQNPGY